MTKPEQLPSSLHRITDQMGRALSAIGKQVTPLHLESWAITIHQVMTARERKYHVPQHLFDMIEHCDPIATLAVLYHDMIYLNVDKRIHPYIADHFKDVTVNEKNEFTIPQTSYTNDAAGILHLTAQIFGADAGKVLGPFSGVNEFLSALLAGRVLRELLNTWEVIQVLTCIEATIPFRPMATALPERLKKLTQEIGIVVTEQEIKKTVERAIHVSNLDIDNFSSEDPAYFLSNTWSLILEGNPMFNNPLYTIQQYRSGLQRVEAFLRTLKPQVVFQKYGDEPSQAEFNERIKRCDHNLSVAVEYLKLKRIGVSILEALAGLTGGDAPYTLFMGDFKANTSAMVILPTRIEYYLDQTLKQVSLNTLNKGVLKVLEEGRTLASSFDLRNSPYTSYIYRRTTTEELATLDQASIALADKKIAPADFLLKMPRPLMQSVANAAAELAWTRADQIKAWLAAN